MSKRMSAIKFFVFLLGLMVQRNLWPQAKVRSRSMGLQQVFKGGYITVTIMALFFGFTGCSSSVPTDILTKDEMAKAMTEFYLKETKINALMISQDSALVLFQYFKQKYADDYDLPDSAIDKSYQYYLGRPVEMGEIYDRVIDTLALKEQRAIEK